MKLETIFRAALRDIINGKAEPHCGRPPYHMNPNEPLDGIEWAEEYKEPGYDNPENGIIFANWNQYPSRLIDILEKAGYAIEWSDEWSTCSCCNGAVRTQPDSYSWRKSYWLDEKNGDILCVDCVIENLDDYEAFLLNNPRNADLLDIDWQPRGFVKINKESFESGFHAGQNDKPEKIAKTVPAKHDYLFVIPSVSQFDLSFDLWIRPQEETFQRESD